MPDPRARTWLLRHWLLCLLDRSRRFNIGERKVAELRLDWTDWLTFSALCAVPDSCRLRMPSTLVAACRREAHPGAQPAAGDAAAVFWAGAGAGAAGTGWV